MNISLLSIIIMIMCSCTASCLEEKEEKERMKGRPCRNPKGPAGSVRLDGCLKYRCSKGKWKTEMRTDICCYMNKTVQAQVYGLDEKVEGLNENLDALSKLINESNADNQKAFLQIGEKVGKVSNQVAEKVDGLEESIESMNKTIEGLNENLDILTKLVKDSNANNSKAFLQIKSQNTLITKLIENIGGDLQCGKNHTILRDAWRRIEYGVKHPTVHCDKPGSSSSYTNLVEGWYRFSFPSAPYAKIPTTAPLKQYVGGDMQSCGTHAVAWMEDSLPGIGDSPKDVTIYFASDGWSDYPKSRPTPAEIVACPDGGEIMYLYNLSPISDCFSAYCAM